MRYLWGTLELTLILEDDKAHIVKWWVDGAFATHHDMRSHTSVTMTIGKGSMYSSSTRQKMNSRSSTDVELITADDAMSQVLWTNWFLEAQGYTSNDTILYQDNKSAILLENNGKASSGKRTRHLDIRYFFITDQIVKKQLHVEYCPTDDILGDYFTKP